MNIRKAENRDIPRIGAMLEQVNAVHHEGRPDIFKRGRKYTDDELSDIIADGSRPLLVATDDADNAVGYAFCIVERHPESRILTAVDTLYVDDLCVDASARRSGVGSALCRAVADMARDMGCRAVTLNVWSCNPRAMGFYENCGFSPRKVCMEMVLSGGDASGK